MSKTALIILNYNNFEDTINCINSVENYNSAPIKYIIVDNGSTRKESIQIINDFLKERFNNRFQHYDYEKEQIPDTLPDVSFVVSKTNDGYAQGNNKGLEYAYADKDISDVMILNNDVLFVEDIIPQLIKIREGLKDAAIVSPILFKKGLVDYDYNCARLCHSNWEIILTFLLWYKDIFHYISKKTDKRYLLKKCFSEINTIQVELPSGSCMLIDKALMNKIGGFDPHTFLYFEENILFKKISNLGLYNYVFPQLKCIHLGASSTSRSNKSFVLKAGLNSASYYLKNYGNMDFLQKIIWCFSYNWFRVKILIKKLLN